MTNATLIAIRNAAEIRKIGGPGRSLSVREMALTPHYLSPSQ